MIFNYGSSHYYGKEKHWSCGCCLCLLLLSITSIFPTHTDAWLCFHSNHVSPLNKCHKNQAGVFQIDNIIRTNQHVRNKSCYCTKENLPNNDPLHKELFYDSKMVYGVNDDYDEVHADKERRKLFRIVGGITICTLSECMPLPGYIFMDVNRDVANAIPFLPPAKERRQLELCIVIILRMQYWAQNVAYKLYSNDNQESTILTPMNAGNVQDWNVNKYLEARLGAKALLTGRIGGGSPPRVYDMSQLKIKECLDDLVYASKAFGVQRLAQNDAETIIDSLASIVEFDGLETIIDPSPRSSLMLSMFSIEKGIYVRRMMIERLIPACSRVTKLFGDQVYEVCNQFMLQNYRNEIFVR